MPHQGRQICIDYYLKAGQAADEYHGFIDLWLSFNSWMACVSGAERDADMVRSIGNDQRLSQSFVDLMREEPTFGQRTKEFAEMWPIFKVQDVIRFMGRDFPYHHGNRRDFTEAVVDDPRIKRQPNPWTPGQEVRWSDLISAIYQVRCNLMHGHKSLSSESDRELVGRSLDLLRTFIDRSGCYHWTTPTGGTHDGASFDGSRTFLS